MSRIKTSLILVLMLGLTVSAIMASVYIPTSHDTGLPPETITYDDLQPDEFELLYETEYLSYFYREDRDIIAIKDKRNGYLWKTGIDIEFNKYLEEACNLVPDEEKINCAPLEDRLNTTYTGIANSLLTVEYYDNSSSIRRLSSASDAGVTSRLATVNNNPNHRRLDVNFELLSIEIKMHIYFDNEGIRYEIRDEDITGTGVRQLAGIMLTPFMGASGGAKAFWDPDQYAYRTIVPNPKLDGYVLVPDGPGALIRFVDHNTSLTSYNGNIYGEDLAESDFYYTRETSYLPLKSPMMPVFGVAHGNRQAAFVAYATSGGEYMNIIVSPEQNLTNYTFAYPRFEINKLFHQVYNRRGDGYFKLMDNRNHFDMSMRYDFLANDGTEDGYPADYVGMALKYRDYLKANDGLPTTTRSIGDIPIRLDFVMSDIKRSVFGLEDVIATTANQVKDILADIKDKGINHVSSGLLGWQRGGITSGHPGRTSWKSAIGSQNDFKALNDFAKSIGYDVSMSQDYVTIHRDQVNYLNTAAKHMNGWYLEYRLRDTMPVTLFGYARPSVSARWLLEQSQRLSRLGYDSLTVEGISNILMSEFSKEGSEVHKTIDLYQSTFEKMYENWSIAATTPNEYLWKYVDRFLQAPVYSSQFLIQTDTVPFLQLVINNNMEMFAPYSNFSFYTKQDVLRMIDYNLSPSFVLTHEPSYQLTLTNSARFYSTEYTQYQDLIQSIYREVNDALKQVTHAKWIDRIVLENGVIMNVYDNNMAVIINYTESNINVMNTSVNAQSAKAIVMEVQP
jgi:hypothetical protein